jgi:hypothetical protein
VVSINISVHLHVIFNWVRISRKEEALYSAHWPGTILLFAIAIRQRRTHEYKFFLSLRHNFFNLYVPNVLEYFYSSKTKGRKYPNLNDKIVKDKDENI